MEGFIVTVIFRIVRVGVHPVKRSMRMVRLSSCALDDKVPSEEKPKAIRHEWWGTLFVLVRGIDDLHDDVVLRCWIHQLTGQARSD